MARQGKHDFGGTRGITNLAPATQNGEPLTWEQRSTAGSNIQIVGLDVDFGTSSTYQEVEVAATWVTADTRIVPVFDWVESLDHSPSDALLEQMQATVVSSTVGVGFTLAVYAPSSTFGIFTIICLGIG